MSRFCDRWRWRIGEVEDLGIGYNYFGSSLPRSLSPQTTELAGLKPARQAGVRGSPPALACAGGIKIKDPLPPPDLPFPFEPGVFRELGNDQETAHPQQRLIRPTPHLPPKGGIWACELVIPGVADGRL